MRPDLDVSTSLWIKSYGHHFKVVKFLAMWHTDIKLFMPKKGIPVYASKHG